MSYLSSKNVLFFCSILILPFFVFFISKTIYLGYSDFAAYYFGSKQLLAGNYMNAYATSQLNLIIDSLGFQDLFVSYTPFPPFTSILFAPFTYIPIHASKIIFNILSCLLFLYSLIRCFNRFSINPVFLVCLPILFYTPIRSNIYFGQAYLLLFCLLVEGYLAYEKKQTLLSSLLWGIAILFKIFPVLIVLFLLLKKEYKHTLYLSGVCILLMSISILLNGFDSWRFYITELLPRLNNGELNDSYTYIFQSAFMLFKNLFVYDEVMNSDVIYPNNYLFFFLLVLFKTITISSCVMATLRSQRNNFLVFSLWIVGSILISPNGSTYSLILLLIPLLALLALPINTTQKIIMAILLLLICNIPVHYFAQTPTLLKFPRLYLLLTFFALLLTILKLKFDYRIVATCIIMFLFIESPRLSADPDNSTYFLSDHKHLMVYDYRITDNGIRRSSGSVEGGKKDSLSFTFKKYSENDLVIKENQIYFKNTQITFSRDWKTKPMLIDNSFIVYLSDKKRGIGFYTLRKINLPQQILNH